jgi:hypothetical protein
MSSDPSGAACALPPVPFFRATDWAELGPAAVADTARLDRLIRLYWTPLRIFLVASFPSLKDQADVLLQEFAEDKILKTGWLHAPTPTRQIPRFPQNQPAQFRPRPPQPG